MSLAGVVAFGACADDEGDDDDSATTGTGTGSGTGTGTGGGTSTGSGGAGGQGGVSPQPDCASVSGICTEARWVECPSGMEPVDPDPHRDCPGDGAEGWCCVDAPPSTCSDDSPGNCIVGSSCEECWAPVEGYTCEDGRVCCEDNCH